MVKLTVNGRVETLDVPGDMPLLWALREVLGLTGAKFGCGAGLCGACSVHVDGKLVRSCVMPVSQAAGRAVTTIEGLAAEALTRAWIAEEVPQCGYCQTGQIMAAAALLAKRPAPTDAEIDAAMTNVCRCGTYARIRAAIHKAAGGGR